MSRLLCQLSYSALTVARAGRAPPGAPIGNRTLDLLLTMETLCRLSYRGAARADPGSGSTVHGAGGRTPNRRPAGAWRLEGRRRPSRPTAHARAPRPVDRAGRPAWPGGCGGDR